MKRVGQKVWWLYQHHDDAITMRYAEFQPGVDITADNLNDEDLWMSACEMSAELDDPRMVGTFQWA
jgi:hypothetical protein